MTRQDKPCKHCVWYVTDWCGLNDEPTSRDGTCQDWQREPGSDDDKGEDDGHDDHS
jgi:hypothetical protein